MITLYHAPHSCSLAVKAALTKTGVEFDTTIINFSEGDHKKEAFLKINPLAKVPAITVDGHILTEGAAINLYLSEKYPEAGLMPEAGTLQKANALKWLQFMYATVHPQFSIAFYPERYGDDKNSIKAKAEAEIHRLFSIINSELEQNPFIAGDQLTLADLYLMTVIHWGSVLEKPIISSYKAIDKFEQRMFSVPVVGDVFQQEYNASS